MATPRPESCWVSLYPRRRAVTRLCAETRPDRLVGLTAFPRGGPDRRRISAAGETSPMECLGTISES